MLLRVTTHSGDEHLVEVESYDPITLNEQINNHEIYSVVIGDHIYSRIDLKNIIPVDNTEGE